MNLIRRSESKRTSLSAARPRIVTDSAFGGPAPVLRFLNPAQYDSPRLGPFLLAGAVAHNHAEHEAEAERYFRRRPQFGTEGAPDYTSERGTLPLYVSAEERESVRTELESVVRELEEVSRGEIAEPVVPRGYLPE